MSETKIRQNKQTKLSNLCTIVTDYNEYVWKWKTPHTKHADETAPRRRTNKTKRKTPPRPFRRTNKKNEKRPHAQHAEWTAPRRRMEKTHAPYRLKRPHAQIAIPTTPRQKRLHLSYHTHTPRTHTHNEWTSITTKLFLSETKIRQINVWVKLKYDKTVKHSLPSVSHIRQSESKFSCI